MSFSAHEPPHPDDIGELTGQIEMLLGSIEKQTVPEKPALLALTPDRQRSAENLLAYLALRNRDLRPLQDQLTRHGLPSLGRVEPHVLATLKSIHHYLKLEQGITQGIDSMSAIYPYFDSNVDLLEKNTRHLLGPHPPGRRAYIVVTMPGEAADDYLFVEQLLKAGMDCMRINCAHGDPASWSRMIEHLHNAKRSTGRHCRIEMDLCGPKLRTGPMESVPAVLKIRPVRAPDGRVIRPARIWLSPIAPPHGEIPAADACLVLDNEWLKQLKGGDRVRMVDARGSRRSWRIRELTSGGCWAESRKTTYLRNGLVLTKGKRDHQDSACTSIEQIPPGVSVIRLRVGDHLLMSCSEEPGAAAIHDDNGELLSPGKVSLATRQVYRDIRLGDPVCFDDGRITGVVEKLGSKQLQIRITHTHKAIEPLEGGRGVNLPETRLNLPALGQTDLRDLEFAVRHADIIGLSFTNSVEDVRALYSRLSSMGRTDVGVILKIETKSGVSNLPAIILEAFKLPTFGIMIARGDLAVECGFENLAEIQQDMLWVCEAAHVPIIWATQVLEGLTKRGHVSRAEITDAAMSGCAEAIMLNKGKYVIDAVKMLAGILERTRGRHPYKGSAHRKLPMASKFVD